MCVKFKVCVHITLGPSYIILMNPNIFKLKGALHHILSTRYTTGSQS